MTELFGTRSKKIGERGMAKALIKLIEAMHEAAERAQPDHWTRHRL